MFNVTPIGSSAKVLQLNECDNASKNYFCEKSFKHDGIHVFGFGDLVPSLLILLIKTPDKTDLKAAFII